MDMLAAHSVPDSFIESEVSQMQVIKYVTTQNRSVERPTGIEIDVRAAMASAHPTYGAG